MNIPRKPYWPPKTSLAEYIAKHHQIPYHDESRESCSRRAPIQIPDQQKDSKESYVLQLVMLAKRMSLAILFCIACWVMLILLFSL